MFIDPQIINWLLIGGASLCAFMIGFNFRPTTNQIISDTIIWMVDNNYAKGRENSDGELELLELDDK